MAIEDTKRRACVAFLYATGCRASEVNKLESKNIRLTTDLFDRKIIRISTITLKNKTDKDRLIPVHINSEKWLAKLIWRYKKSHEGKLFDVDRATIWRWCMEAFGINPHGFRKIRGTHLVTKFKFSDQALTKFMGWTDSRPARYYIKLRIEDIVPEIKTIGGVSHA